MKRSWCLSLVAVSCAACNDEAPRGGLVLMLAQDGSLAADGLRLEFAGPDQPMSVHRWAIPKEADLPVTVTFEAKRGSASELNIEGSLWAGDSQLDRREFVVSNIPKDRYAAVELLFGARCSSTNPSAPVCGSSQTCNPKNGRCVDKVLDAADLPEYEPALEETLTWDAPSGQDAGVTSGSEGGVSLPSTGTEPSPTEGSSTVPANTSSATYVLDGGTSLESSTPSSGVGSSSSTSEPENDVSQSSETGTTTTSAAPGSSSDSSASSPRSTEESTSSPSSMSETNDAGPACTYGSYWHDGSCTPWSTCAAGNYVLVEGTDEANRVCEACAPNTFSTEADWAECLPFTHCGFREQEAEGSPTHDATCAAGDVVFQFGSDEGDTASSVTVDTEGSVYVVGYTEGSLFATNAGGWDAFIQKRSPTGTIDWSRQFGTTTYDRLFDVIPNSNGDVTVVGSTEGDLAGAHGFADILLRRYKANGDVVWTSQYGSPNLDMAYSIAETDAGSLVVAGRTYGSLSGVNPDGADFFVSSFSATGEHEWSQQIGSDTADFRGSAVSVDSSGDIVAVGNTVAGFGGDDVTLLKLTAEGIVSWQQSFGSNAQDVALAVTTDEDDNIYVAGYTYGKLGAADQQGVDAWVSKRTPAGALIWIDQFGTNAEDAAQSIAIYGSTLYVAGQWGNETDLSDDQVFVRRYTLAGTDPVTHVIGTTETDYGYALALASGRVFLSGDTSGDFGADNAGSYDAFLTQVVLP